MSILCSSIQAIIVFGYGFVTNFVLKGLRQQIWRPKKKLSVGWVEHLTLNLVSLFAMQLS